MTVCAIFISSLSVACNGNQGVGAAKAAAEANRAGQYIRRSSADKHFDRALVFVHGILGDARSTWTASGGAYWPELVTHDPAFDSFSVWVYDYDSRLLSRSLTIDELADNLRLRLDDSKIFSEHREVYFVCHSMGGLVSRALLQKYQPLASQVPMMYFFSTPTTGAEIAHLGALVGRRNPQLRDMFLFRAKDNAYVGNLIRQWLAARFRIRSYCAYETQSTFGVQIVQPDSATHLCTERLDPILANHITIVKPESDTSDSHVALRSAVTETLAIERPIVRDGLPDVHVGPADCSSEEGVCRLTLSITNRDDTALELQGLSFKIEAFQLFETLGSYVPETIGDADLSQYRTPSARWYPIGIQRALTLSPSGAGGESSTTVSYRLTAEELVAAFGYWRIALRAHTSAGTVDLPSVEVMLPHWDTALAPPIN